MGAAAGKSGESLEVVVDVTASGMGTSSETRRLFLADSSGGADTVGAIRTSVAAAIVMVFPCRLTQSSDILAVKIWKPFLRNRSC